MKEVLSLDLVAKINNIAHLSKFVVNLNLIIMLKPKYTSIFIFTGRIFLSSPEHKVLKVSYCDRPLSVVRASVRRQLLL